MDLEGANAMITGASRGIGARVAGALAARGANLALAARTASDLETLRPGLPAGVRIVTIPCDVSTADGRRHLLERATDSLGPVDILVNNAGIERASRFAEVPVEHLERSVQVNLLAPILLTRALLPGMLERGRGHVVNMASLAGRVGVPFDAVYAATKAGLVGFTESLRVELEGSPVGVSVICPGFVREEGIYARMAAAGVRAPRLPGTTSLAKVTEAVVDAITSDRGDLIVNDLPLRPLLALAVSFPGLVPPLMRAFRVTAMWDREARRQADLSSGPLSGGPPRDSEDHQPVGDRLLSE